MKSDSSLLIVKDGIDLIFLLRREIDYIEAAGSYRCVHVGNKTVTTSCTLSKFEDDLQSDFARIHYSYLVNIYRIEKLRRVLVKFPHYEVLLKCGLVLPLAVEREQLVLEKIGWREPRKVTKVDTVNLELDIKNPLTQVGGVL